MMLDLLDMIWQSKSTDQNQAYLTNMYLEADTAKGKYKYIALPMPGLSLFKATNLSPIRDLYEFNGVLYAVANNKFIRVASDGTITQLGTLTTSSGYAKIKAIFGGTDTNNQIFIKDSNNGYAYNLGTSTATFPIADVDFPQDGIDLENQDDYIIVAKKNSNQFQISNLSDTTSWDALDFASKYAQSDNLQAINIHQSKLWLIGDKTSEIWYNNGDANFPFGRMSDTMLHFGTKAKRTLANNGNYFLFLESNSRGGYRVVQVLPSVYGTTPSPVSTPPIDTIISSFTTISDAHAYIYNKDGHEFYDITFPSEGVTLTYDIPVAKESDTLKGGWYYRKSYNGATYGRFLANCQAFCYGKNLVGDYNSGNIYYQDSSNYTENDTPIIRQLVTPPGPTYNSGNRVFIHKLQIDVETDVGSNKTFTLEKSLDNGNTWLSVGTYTVPEKGNRIIINGLGSTRYGMIFRITTTMNGKFIILGFQAQVSLGHS